MSFSSRVRYNGCCEAHSQKRIGSSLLLSSLTGLSLGAVARSWGAFQPVELLSYMKRFLYLLSQDGDNLLLYLPAFCLLYIEFVEQTAYKSAIRFFSRGMLLEQFVRSAIK